jgi:hypothetical protein
LERDLTNTGEQLELAQAELELREQQPELIPPAQAPERNRSVHMTTTTTMRSSTSAARASGSVPS